jgi:hypothetical protein
VSGAAATLALAGLISATAAAQVGRLEVREVECAPEHGDPILREDFERCEPAAAVVRDERKPDTWVLRTKDWPSPLLNPVGRPTSPTTRG